MLIQAKISIENNQTAIPLFLHCLLNQKDHALSDVSLQLFCMLLVVAKRDVVLTTSENRLLIFHVLKVFVGCEVSCCEQTNCHP